MKLKAMTMIDLAGEKVAVPTEKTEDGFNGIVRLNRTAEDIFNGLAEQKTENEIAASLVEKYDEVDFDRALEQVQMVIRQLKEAGLLEE